ncbi:hypothetical protein HZB02_00660 [Candidatus Woesearchaeota archaeon]|nr:hypothetical protein [Candidatus Woesearchaeota archaeon]
MEKIFQILLDQDELTWQTIINDLIRTEQMDPWDIDIGMLAQRFLDKLREFKQMDFRISGKVILAAAIMLRMKSTRFMDVDMNNLNRMFAAADGEQEEYDEPMMGDMSIQPTAALDLGTPRLLPKTPQPRERKISVYDLMEALDKALEINRKRSLRQILPAPPPQRPVRKVDITSLIFKIYRQIEQHFKGNEEKLLFSNFSKGKNKEEQLLTIYPLLHLETQRKIDMNQEVPFGEIEIMLRKDDIVRKKGVEKAMA